MQTAHSRLFADIEKVRDDLSADIRDLDDRLRAVEIDVAAIRTAVIGIDARTGAARRSRYPDTTEAGGREADRPPHEAG